MVRSMVRSSILSWKCSKGACRADGGGREIILKSIFMKLEEEAWTRLLWLRIGTGGGRL